MSMTPEIVIKLNKILFAMLGSEELVTKWWSSPNKAFDLKTPTEVFAKNKDAVVTYILNQYQR